MRYSALDELAEVLNRKIRENEDLRDELRAVKKERDKAREKLMRCGFDSPVLVVSEVAPFEQHNFSINRELTITFTQKVNESLMQEMGPKMLPWIAEEWEKELKNCIIEGMIKWGRERFPVHRNDD